MPRWPLLAGCGIRVLRSLWKGWRNRPSLACRNGSQDTATLAHPEPRTEMSEDLEEASGTTPLEHLEPSRSEQAPKSYHSC